MSHVKIDRQSQSGPELGADFVQRLALALPTADHERRRRMLYQWVRSCFPLVLLVGPIVGWRLMVASPGGAHVAIDALAWLTFLLDVGVHVDGDLLSFLGLQALPPVVFVLILAILAGWLLGRVRGSG